MRNIVLNAMGKPFDRSVFEKEARTLRDLKQDVGAFGHALKPAMEEVAVAEPVRRDLFLLMLSALNNAETALALGNRPKAKIIAHSHYNQYKGTHNETTFPKTFESCAADLVLAAFELGFNTSEPAKDDPTELLETTQVTTTQEVTQTNSEPPDGIVEPEDENWLGGTPSDWQTDVPAEPTSGQGDIPRPPQFVSLATALLGQPVDLQRLNEEIVAAEMAGLSFFSPAHHDKGKELVDCLHVLSGNDSERVNRLKRTLRAMQDRMMQDKALEGDELMGRLRYDLQQKGLEEPQLNEWHGIISFLAAVHGKDPATLNPNVPAWKPPQLPDPEEVIRAIEEGKGGEVETFAPRIIPPDRTGDRAKTKPPSPVTSATRPPPQMPKTDRSSKPEPKKGKPAEEPLRGTPAPTRRRSDPVVRPQPTPAPAAVRPPQRPQAPPSRRQPAPPPPAATRPPPARMPPGPPSGNVTVGQGGIYVAGQATISQNFGGSATPATNQASGGWINWLRSNKALMLPFLTILFLGTMFLVCNQPDPPRRPDRIHGSR